jgi:hypothetical protein
MAMARSLGEGLDEAMDDTLVPSPWIGRDGAAADGVGKDKVPPSKAALALNTRRREGSFMFTPVGVGRSSDPDRPRPRF